MLILKKINETEESYRLLYSFTSSNDPNWKQANIMATLMQGQIPIKQGSLSDYEYFKNLRKQQNASEFLSSNQYLLLKDNIPVTSIYIMMKNKNVADISFFTAKKYQRMGYATYALTLIEQLLFNNPEIIFTTITDLSKEKISSRIAIKAGYTQSDQENIFIKANPNINLEDFLENKNKTKN